MLAGARLSSCAWPWRQGQYTRPTMMNQPARDCAGQSSPTLGRYSALIEMLHGYSGEGAFNQYRDVDPSLDLPEGAAIRRANLLAYLEAFAGARHVLVGEGAGYAGCRFSGIPFTCEEQLVGEAPLPWTTGCSLARSSRSARPWAELSAKIVWAALGDSRSYVLWNAFPWHPYGDAGPLSNRAPGRDLQDGLGVLGCLLSLFPGATPCAIGRVAERALREVGIHAPYIRHPSHGGKKAFCAGIDELKQELAREATHP